MYEPVVLQFDTYSQAQMIFLSFTLIGSLFAAVRIKSLVGVGAWTFSAIALIGNMEFGVGLVYYWFMLILTAMALTIGMFAKISR